MTMTSWKCGLLCAVWSLAGCHPRGAVTPPDPAPLHEEGAPPAEPRAETRTVQPPEETPEPVTAPEPAFRPFTPPEALSLDTQAHPTRRRDLVLVPGRGCRGVGDRAEYERQRELAALDAELRRQGGMLLGYATVHPTAAPARAVPGGASAPGAVLRGRDGERLLVVGYGNGCQELPLVAIDADGEVFTVFPDPEPRRTRRLRVCRVGCGGCGARMPPKLLVVEVPADARLVETRQITFPMDVRVTFRPVEACQPVP